MGASEADTLHRLFEVIKSRKGADPSTSYTAKLLARGTEKCAQKLGEEAVETVIAAVSQGKAEVIAESADMLYHWLTVLAARDIELDEVLAALEKREGTSGLAEKASRKKG